MDTLGDLQHLVLLAILRLDGEAYGVSIRDEIADTAGRRLSLGAIYSALRRLEAKGLIRSRKGSPEPVTGGRAKTFFDLAPGGLDAIRGTQRELERMLDGLSGLPLSPSTRGREP